MAYAPADVLCKLYCILYARRYTYYVRLDVTGWGKARLDELWVLESWPEDASHSSEYCERARCFALR